MAKLSIINKLTRTIGAAIGLFGLYTLVGCSASLENVDYVGSSLSAGRLVPAAAVDIPDILNQYEHDYPQPLRSGLAAHIEYDRQNVITHGDDILAQVAITSKRPSPGTIRLHVLGLDEDIKKEENRTFAKAILHTLQLKLKNYPASTSVTLDMVGHTKLATNYRQFLHQQYNTLKDMLGAASLMAMDKGRHHFILMVGDLNDQSDKSKQDMVDMARIITAKGAKLSVISYGDKPPLAFLAQVAKNGNGKFKVKTDHINLEEWARKEIEHVYAYPIKNISITLRGNDQAKLVSVVSPSNLQVTSNKIVIDIPQMLAGQTYVSLVKIAMPKIDKKSYRIPLILNISYQSGKSGKFYTVKKYKKISYTMDVNEALPGKYNRIARSELILGTKKTIIDVAEYIRQRRNYMAIADITRQQTSLQKYVTKKSDSNLERDIRVLKQYAENLQKFDDSWFKQIKIWKDLDWDNERFTQEFH